MLFAFRHLSPPQTKNGKISQVTDRERDLTFSNWKPYAYDHFFAFLFSNGSKGKLKWYILVDGSKVVSLFSFFIFLQLLPVFHSFFSPSFSFSAAVCKKLSPKISSTVNESTLRPFSFRPLPNGKRKTLPC